MNFKVFFIIPIVGILFFGCADKQKFNQTDEFWYKDILKSLGRLDIDKADDAFSSLEAEHIHSPLVKTAVLILIEAHIQQEDYILANYYMDKYNLRFGTKESKEYIEYLRIKSKYMAFKQPKRDQKLLRDTLGLIQDYLFMYPNSKYNPYVQTMKTNLEIAEHNLNIDIIVLYKKLDKPKAVKFYKERDNMSWINLDNVKQPDISFIRALFE